LSNAPIASICFFSSSAMALRIGTTPERATEEQINGSQ